jgi:hypothetical protein
MQVRTEVGLLVLALLSGCTELLGLTDPIVCYEFSVEDEFIAADPADAYPGEDFVLSWKNYTDVPPEEIWVAPNEPALVESLSLRDPISGAVVVALPDREVPYGSPATSSIAFSEFVAAPGFVPADYTFNVELHPPPDTVAECPAELVGTDTTGQFPLVLPCECDGLYSYGLRIEGATTDPPNPVVGEAINIVFTAVYDGIPCEGAAPVESGAFQGEITITGEPGQAGPDAFSIPSMLSGTSSPQVIPTSEIVGAARPVGVYNVTVALDAAGVVPECTSQGEVDTTDQVALFSFEVSP